jgi:3-phosphoshikimate 1-carboxyvinyltransferase
MRERTIRPAAGPLDCELRAAPSKSVTHRALVAAALARGRSTLRAPLDADDTRATRDGLASLGFPVREAEGCWILDGRETALRQGGQLHLGESGTSMRFLTAVAALGSAASRLDGAPRLRERPMHELAEALGQLGADVRLSAAGGLPLQAGGRRPVGGSIRLPSGRSSQFASALLLVASSFERGLDLRLEPPVVSLPYVELTAAVLRRFGVVVERRGDLQWRVESGDYPGREYQVEGDHSSASYPLAAAAIVGGRVRVRGLDPQSAQPDARLGRILARAGCAVRTGPSWIEVAGDGRIETLDLRLEEAPDLVPTLAVLALFAEGPSTLRGIAHLRLKESDRLAVLERNLCRLGREARAGQDQLWIGPRTGPLQGTTILTGSDHRMAMAFAVAGLRLKGMRIDDPACVVKSNPGFWDQLARLEGHGSPDRP